MDADELTDASRGGSSRIGRRLYRCDISSDDSGDQPGIDLLPSHEHDVGRFDHGVRRLDHADQAARFDETEGFSRKIFCHERQVYYVIRPRGRDHRDVADGHRF